ncbi:MAG: RNA-processing protein [Methanosarcinales archaeon]|nr:RNA-processing protein [Methanosarcinales archaeon]
MMTHIKIPQDRIGAIIGPKGNIKKLIEEKSCAKIEIDSKNGTVELKSEKDPLLSMRAHDVIRAIARGFNPEKAMELFDDDLLMLDVIDISRSANTQKDLMRLKGRIIGKGGIMRENIENTLNTKISIYGKTVSAIGHIEEIQIVRTAIDMLINGAVHGSVYDFLEKKKRKLMEAELRLF